MAKSRAERLRHSLNVRLADTHLVKLRQIQRKRGLKTLGKATRHAILSANVCDDAT
jgi:hypothetical protein